MLAILLIRRDGGVSMGDLIEAIWGDPDKEALNSRRYLSKTVGDLREIIGDDAILTNRKLEYMVPRMTG